ncbi:hypothetical protein PM082_011154 [Marasmius tenuissimus]|nr:hypothetical protein PM082_011154 [Marasmius tenuissimus]
MHCKTRQKDLSENSGKPGEDASKIVDSHIKLLHRYNEAKDVTQMLIGRLANMKETTVREIHRELGLPETD